MAMKHQVHLFDSEMNYPAAFGFGFYIPSVSYEVELPEVASEETPEEGTEENPA